MDLTLAPTFAGAAAAAIAVAAGAPLFSDGLRTLRLGRSLVRATERPLAGRPEGFVRVRGRVVLDSPLFSPLSAQPCAGYRLSISADRHGAIGAIEDFRAFRIVDGGVTAQVAASHARWQLSPGMRREVAAADTLSENLSALIARSPEAMWLRRSGATLVLIEHALMAGGECHVVGEASLSRPYEAIALDELARTGTDDAQVSSADSAQRGRANEPDLWVDDGGSLEYLLVADRAPGTLVVPHARWRSLGLLAGPFLTLGGLLHLASLAERLAGFGR